MDGTMWLPATDNSLHLELLSPLYVYLCVVFKCAGLRSRVLFQSSFESCMCTIQVISCEHVACMFVDSILARTQH